MEYRKDDYQTKVEKAAATFLARWNGGTARLYELSVSHPSLRIRLTQEERRQGWYLEIACLEPEWIQGPRVWGNCQIEILAHQQLRSGEEGFRIVDVNANLIVETTSLEVNECQYRKGRPD